jgi:U6 snRNA-associated Sm-like protein LSm6
MENGGISQGEGKDPSSFLSDIIGNSVVVKLNSGVVYKGKFLLEGLNSLTLSTLKKKLWRPNFVRKTTGELQSVDGYMNIALEKTVEYVNGTKRREYGDTFVRGNNGE